MSIPSRKLFDNPPVDGGKSFLADWFAGAGQLTPDESAAPKAEVVVLEAGRTEEGLSAPRTDSAVA